MRSLHTLSDKEGSLPAYAVKTRAHRFHTSAFGFTEWKSSYVPAKLFFGNPSLFSSSWSYPNPGFPTRVNDGKAPLSFQIQNISIRNQLGTKRIDNFDYVLSQNEFRSKPNKVDNSPKDETKQKFEECLCRISANPEAIYSEKNYQDNGSTSPNEITSRPEGFIHSLSIAGERK
jgi:hypothetical protein